LATVQVLKQSKQATALELSAPWQAKQRSTLARFGALDASSLRLLRQSVSSQSTSRQRAQSEPAAPAHLTHAAAPSAVGSDAQVAHLEVASSVLVDLTHDTQSSGFLVPRQALQVLAEKSGGQRASMEVFGTMPDTQPSEGSAGWGRRAGACSGQGRACVEVAC
jgi:hypothetical protein